MLNPYEMLALSIAIARIKLRWQYNEWVFRLILRRGDTVEAIRYVVAIKARSLN